MTYPEENSGLRAGQATSALLVALFFLSPLGHRVLPSADAPTAVFSFGVAVAASSAILGFVLAEMGYLFGDGLVGWAFERIPEDRRRLLRNLVVILDRKRESFVFLPTSKLGETLRLVAVELTTIEGVKESGWRAKAAFEAVRTLALLYWSLAALIVSQAAMLAQWILANSPPFAPYDASLTILVLSVGASFLHGSFAWLVRASCGSRLNEAVAMLLVAKAPILLSSFPPEGEALPKKAAASKEAPMAPVSAPPEEAAPPTAAWSLLLDDVLASLGMKSRATDGGSLNYRFGQLDALVRNSDFPKPGASAQRERLRSVLTEVAEDPKAFLAGQNRDGYRAFVRALHYVLMEAPEEKLHDEAEGALISTLHFLKDHDRDSGLWRELARNLGGCTLRGTAEWLTERMLAELGIAGNDRRILTTDMIQGILSTSLGQLHAEYWVGVISDLTKKGAGDVVEGHTDAALRLANGSASVGPSQLPRFLRDRPHPQFK